MSLKANTPTHIVTPASITWKDDTPHSAAFDDYYFSSEHGEEETDYNFIQRNDLQRRWQALSDQPGTFFTIGETGFGTGLNLLCVWRMWLNMHFTHARLHYVSVDKFPLTKADLTKAYQQWPSLAPLCQELLAAYPPLVPGLHTVELAGGRIRLSLMFDDAANAFNAVQGQVDAWFLDGFTPSRNPDMWSPALFSALARLSAPKATFATFTAAGVVRKGLANAGFLVSKYPGLGPKREICYGVYEGTATPATLPHTSSPWYQLPPHYSTPGTAVIIGAGLAGASVARSLAARGWKVTVVEQHASPAQEGSGNPTGITFTKLSQYNNAQNRFYQLAYLYSTTLIQQLFHNSVYKQGCAWDLNGVVRIAYNDKEAQDQRALIASGLWPKEIATPLDPKATSDLIGFDSPHSSLLLPQGGWLCPADLINLLLEHDNITTQCHTTIQSLHAPDLEAPDGWRLELATNETSSPTSLASDIVVVANSFGGGQFAQTHHLPLRSVRGQVTFVPSTPDATRLRHAINYEGYTAPARAGQHCVGATFHPKRQDRECLLEDHHTNLRNLETGLPSFHSALASPSPNSLSGRVGFRCQTPDYLPIVGPAPDLEQFLVDYARLRKGLLRDPFPKATSHKGLYVSLAHGSRGITSAPFCGELLANMIMGEVVSTDNHVREAIHPARFIIRDMKRRKR